MPGHWLQCYPRPKRWMHPDSLHSQKRYPQGKEIAEKTNPKTQRDREQDVRLQEFGFELVWIELSLACSLTVPTVLWTNVFRSDTNERGTMS